MTLDCQGQAEGLSMLNFMCITAFRGLKFLAACIISRMINANTCTLILLNDLR